MNRAKAQGIFTQLTLAFLPKTADYYVPNQNPGQIEAENWFYLSSEGIDAKKRYIRDLITGLQSLGAPLDYVSPTTSKTNSIILRRRSRSR